MQTSCASSKIMNTPDFKSSFSQFASVVILGLYVSGCASLQHERSEVSSTKALATMPSSSSTAKNTPVDVPHPFVGVWTYRSLLNVAEHEPDINKLLVAEAEPVIVESPSGSIKATVNMDEYASS